MTHAVKRTVSSVHMMPRCANCDGIHPAALLCCPACGEPARQIPAIIVANDAAAVPPVVLAEGMGP